MWQAGIGTGRVRAISQSADDVPSLRSAAKKLGGSLIVEHAPSEVKRQLNVWGDLGDATGLMQRIKKQLDPNRLLSPGRFGPDI
jgi:glycolate oxidase FAD binding subunit